jgi:hypothetical protein
MKNRLGIALAVFVIIALLAIWRVAIHVPAPIGPGNF